MSCDGDTLGVVFVIICRRYFVIICRKLGGNEGARSAVCGEA